LGILKWGVKMQQCILALGVLRFRYPQIYVVLLKAKR
jgi:hypothetical protein